MTAENIHKLGNDQLEELAEKAEMLDKLIDHSAFAYDEDNLGGVQLVVSMEAVDHCESTRGDKYHKDVIDTIRKAMEAGK